MLAHELRRRVAAVRVAGEAIATLRDQGRDTTTLLDLLLAEVADLEQLAGEVLAERRSGPAEAAPDLAATVQAAARTVAVARGDRARPGGRPGRGRGQPDHAAPGDREPDRQRRRPRRARAVEVDVRADPAAGQVEVVVADRGGAEAPEGGHGIGLFVVRRFLDEAGGTSRGCAP